MMKPITRQTRKFRTGQPFDFAWVVPKDGYQIIRGERVELGRKINTSPEPFLIEKGVAAMRPVREYHPLEQRTGLFRIFAETPRTKEGILKFANDYGLLGGSLGCRVSVPSDTPAYASMKMKTAVGDEFIVPTGESVNAWGAEIADMAYAVGIWDALQSGDFKTLSRVIHWTDDGVSARWGDDLLGARRISDKLHAPELQRRFPVGSLDGPAWYLIQNLINEKLNAYPVRITLLWDNGLLTMFDVPSGLLSAMWFQFARAVDSNRQYVRCQSCRNWFEVEGGVKRSDSNYCDTACKQRFYRDVRSGKIKRPKFSKGRAK